MTGHCVLCFGDLGKEAVGIIGVSRRAKNSAAAVQLQTVCQNLQFPGFALVDPHAGHEAVWQIVFESANTDQLVADHTADPVQPSPVKSGSAGALKTHIHAEVVFLHGGGDHILRYTSAAQIRDTVRHGGDGREQMEKIVDDPAAAASKAATGSPVFPPSAIHSLKRQASRHRASFLRSRAAASRITARYDSRQEASCKVF